MVCSVLLPITCDETVPMSNCSDAASPPKRLCTRTSRAHASPRILPARRVPSISPGSGSMIITPCVAAALCRCCHGRDADTFNHLSGMRPQPYAPPQRTFAPACTPTARPTTRAHPPSFSPPPHPSPSTCIAFCSNWPARRYRPSPSSGSGRMRCAPRPAV